MGRIVGGALTMTVAGYLVYLFWLLIRARSLRSVPFVRPAEAARAMLDGAVMYDVRSDGYMRGRRTLRA